MSSPRVLFVDDEPLILQGLRNLLWRERSKWDMVFANGGEQALAEMERAPFDLIVSDLLMPGMDGAELLSEMSNKYPSVVRLVLSGYASRDTMLKTIPVAHQYLTKPCEAAVLRAALQRAVGLREILNDETLRGIVGKITNLPSIPHSYQRLCEVVADPRCGLDQIAEIVEEDPAMTIRVLQLANSACFGSRSQVTSIPQAVRVLGADLVKGLALVGNVLSAIDATSSTELNLDKLQLNWIQSAKLARQFLSDSNKADSAFAATLIRDIGKIIIALKLPDQHREIVETMKTTPRADHLIEKELIGTTHADIGAYLLGAWGLPFGIVESVAFHHAPNPLMEDSRDILAAVHVAGTIADSWDLPEPCLDITAGLDMGFLKATGLISELPRWLALAEAHRAGMNQPSPANAPAI